MVVLRQVATRVAVDPEDRVDKHEACLEDPKKPLIPYDRGERHWIPVRPGNTTCAEVFNDAVNGTDHYQRHTDVHRQ